MSGAESDFLVTDSPEPHAIRRRAILQAHPEVRELFAPDGRMVGVLLAVMAAHAGLAAVVASLCDPARPVHSALLVGLAAMLPGAVASHWASMFIHEAAHDHCAQSPVANRLWAMVASTALGVPAAMTFRKYHRRHHAWLGVRGVDADLPLDCEARLVARRPLLKLGWFLSFIASYLLRGWRHRSPPDRWELANVALVLLSNALVLGVLGPWALAYLLLSTVIGHSIHPVAAHFVHEHFLFEEGQETNSYYGPLNWLTFNVGYHVEHHDLPIIPGTRLPEYHKRTAEFYSGLAADSSWSCVMWRFITDRSLGMSSRVIRAHPNGGELPPGRRFSPRPRLLVGQDGRLLGHSRQRRLDLEVGDTWMPERQR